MPGTVTTQTTRVTAAEAADDSLWDDIGSGQGSSQGSDLPIQGTEYRQRRRDNAVGGSSYDNTTTIDLSASDTHVGFWVACLQPAQVNSIGVRLGGGSTPTTSPWSQWTAITTYPPVGGWQRVWVDPTRTRDSGAGTLNTASIRQFGAEFDVGDVGGNAANVLIDAIDYLGGGGGLLVDSGTVPSPATFQDFLDADEGNSTNVYGVVVSRDGIIFCLARLTIGDATATVFNDDGFVVVFADQALVSSTFMGLTVDLQNASTDVDFTNAIIRSGGSTNLGDLVVTGTSGSFDASGTTFDNLRVVTLTSACTLSSCTINGSGQITAAGATLSGSTVANSTASSALLWDTNADPSGELDDMSFTSAGTGHAIELGSNTPATITLSGHSYSGYAGTDGSTGNEVLYNNSGKAITVNVVGGGSVPAVRNGSGASTTVVANTQVTLTGLVNPTEVRVYEQGTSTEVAGQEDITTGSFQFSDSASDVVDIRIFATEYEPADILGFTVPASDTSIPVQQRFDRNYRNP